MSLISKGVLFIFDGSGSIDIMEVGQTLKFDVLWVVKSFDAGALLLTFERTSTDEQEAKFRKRKERKREIKTATQELDWARQDVVDHTDRMELAAQTISETDDFENVTKLLAPVLVALSRKRKTLDLLRESTEATVDFITSIESSQVSLLPSVRTLVGTTFMMWLPADAPITSNVVTTISLDESSSVIPFQPIPGELLRTLNVDVGGGSVKGKSVFIMVEPLGAEIKVLSIHTGAEICKWVIEGASLSGATVSSSGMMFAFERERGFIWAFAVDGRSHVLIETNLVCISDIAICSDDEIVVSDTFSNKFYVYTTDGEEFREIGFPPNTGQLNLCRWPYLRRSGIDVCGDELVASDHGNSRITVWNWRTGVFLREWPIPEPGSLFVAGGEVIVLAHGFRNNFRNSINVYDLHGNLKREWSVNGQVKFIFPLEDGELAAAGKIDRLLIYKS